MVARTLLLIIACVGALLSLLYLPLLAKKRARRDEPGGRKGSWPGRPIGGRSAASPFPPPPGGTHPPEPGEGVGSTVVRF